jgi:hypothetical protein
MITSLTLWYTKETKSVTRTVTGPSAGLILARANAVALAFLMWAYVMFWSEVTDGKQHQQKQFKSLQHGKTTWPLTIQMNTASIFRKMVKIYISTWCHSPESNNFHRHHHQNLTQAQHHMHMKCSCNLTTMWICIKMMLSYDHGERKHTECLHMKILATMQLTATCLLAWIPDLHGMILTGKTNFALPSYVKNVMSH